MAGPAGTRLTAQHTILLANWHQVLPLSSALLVLSLVKLQIILMPAGILPAIISASLVRHVSPFKCMRGQLCPDYTTP
jgi:hypothetical protein